MSLSNLLVANRGEIAIRVMRAAAELGLDTCGIYSQDDVRCLHIRKADEALALSGTGARAYLEVEEILSLAKRAGVDAIHPGYGFLSESSHFAARCQEEGICFIGPSPEVLSLLGDKAAARELARRCGVPIVPGSRAACSFDEAREFQAARVAAGGSAAVLIKAVAGGGGRGIRVARSAEELKTAFERCQSEAQGAFGEPAVYVEAFVDAARHLEVQIIGDGQGGVSHLWERECTLQRSHQKLLEIAPAADLESSLAQGLRRAALDMAGEVGFESLGTFEFLVSKSLSQEGVGDGFAFIEANPRLQVEHTVSEEITGIDLVKSQLEIARGRSLCELGLEQADVPEPRGHAVQVRINMEKMNEKGLALPTGGTLEIFEVPSGPGLRVDSFGYAGYTTNPNFDSLLAKLIAHAPTGTLADALKRAYRALCEFRIEGVGTNIAFLQSLLEHPDVLANRTHTRFVEEQMATLIPGEGSRHPRLFFDSGPQEGEAIARVGMPALAGARIADDDPLAVLDHGKSDTASREATITPHEDRAPGSPTSGPEGCIAAKAPLQGTVVSLDVSLGERVHEGQQLAILEAMKMEHVISAACAGIVREIAVRGGDAVFEGHPLVFVEPGQGARVVREADDAVDLDWIRPDLAEVNERHAKGLDEARPDAVARRRKTGQRTARENIADLCDPGSYVEYGSLVIAAQRRRRSLEDLIERTPADGMLAGVGSINGDCFDEAVSQCVVMSYDYTVLAGTQGAQNHRKKDRMFELAEHSRLPLVFFTEGGGGRPGDTDGLGVAGLDCLAFSYFGRLSGWVPLVGITSGRCFAGNAALLGCCDVVIATEGSNIGMGGPAMIEGGGLGVFRPEEVGPLDVQRSNGVVDIAVADEAEAVLLAKKYLSYFQGAVDSWECADQRMLRRAIPENRLRVYDVRGVIETLADTDSVLELRCDFALGMVTAFIRVEGRPIGVVANNPEFLAGAIDSDGADKASRFMQLCDAFDIPILFLCDTPGIMVGPEAEKRALVRHAARMFVTSGSLTVPFFTIVLRKGYGLGAQAMAGASFKAPYFTISWPTGEFGGMGLEGAVKLGFRKELEAVEDKSERMALFETMVARMYEHGKAVNMASHFEIDAVIDPMESRRWILGALRSAPKAAPRSGKKRPFVDTW